MTRAEVDAYMVTERLLGRLDCPWCKASGDQQLPQWRGKRVLIVCCRCGAYYELGYKAAFKVGPERWSGK